MSTRSIIVIKGKSLYGQDSVNRLYKHSDGYPTGVLPYIIQAIEKADSQRQEVANRFNEAPRPINTDQLTGLIIGACTNIYGMGARLEDIEDNNIYGYQSDLEWIYEIDLNTRSLYIYGGGYSGLSANDVVKKGTVNPIKYVQCLKEDYKQQEKKQINENVKQLKNIGFNVNPKKKPKEGKNEIHN